MKKYMKHMKQLKKSNIFLLLLIMAALPLAAQTSTFDPFVSQLQGETTNNLVRLSWVDSQDVEGPVYIYRSIYPFRGDNLLLTETPAVISYGTQFYEDEIDTVGTFYYFAVASDNNGLRYDFPITSKNTITVHVPGGISLHQESGILSLDIIADVDRIIITFAERNVKSAALYRSTKPIREIQDLFEAVLIQTKITSPFIDYPVPGIPYYYAVISEEDHLQGLAVIIPGRNAASAPVELSAGRPEFYSSGTGGITLPLVSVQSETRWIDTTVEPEPPPPVIEVEIKKPRAFVRDLEASPTEGEEHALISVVRGPFAERSWEEAKIEFIKFIALPGSTDTKIRARFYLGQCYYFLNQPREGLFEFLSIRESFPVETEEWIQALIDMIRS